MVGVPYAYGVSFWRTYEVLAAECGLGKLPEEHQQSVRHSLRIAFSQVAVAYLELVVQVDKDELARRKSR